MRRVHRQEEDGGDVGAECAPGLCCEAASAYCAQGCHLASLLQGEGQIPDQIPVSTLLSSSWWFIIGRLKVSLISTIKILLRL